MTLNSSTSQPSGFAVRPSYPYWTNRQLLNGVIELDEQNIGDALLEEIILGSMNSIKTWLLANGIQEYLSWDNITKTPRAIKRATTYAVIATLYARQVFAPVRPIVSTAPVIPTIMDQISEKGAVFWETLMETILQYYLASKNEKRLYVNTEDEDSWFSMDDIPHM